MCLRSHEIRELLCPQGCCPGVIKFGLIHSIAYQRQLGGSEPADAAMRPILQPVQILAVEVFEISLLLESSRIHMVPQVLNQVFFFGSLLLGSSPGRSALQSA